MNKKVIDLIKIYIKCNNLKKVQFCDILLNNIEERILMDLGKYLKLKLDWGNYNTSCMRIAKSLSKLNNRRFYKAIEQIIFAQMRKDKYD